MTTKDTTYIPLPTVIERDGFTFRQVIRSSRAAVYRQTKGGTSIERYEAIHIGHSGERVLPNGVIAKACERYPRADDWGLKGWTCRTLSEAKVKVGL